MASIRSTFKDSSIVLIKVGTSVVTDDNGDIALGKIGYIVDQICNLIQHNIRCILVTSGSICLGKGLIKNNTDVNDRVYAAAGQSRLMSFYETLFSTKNQKISQILLTENDFSNEISKVNLSETILSLLELNIIPIINENDVTTPKESDNKTIFWDNDSLASLIAIQLCVDLVILLSNVDGVYLYPPTEKDSNITNITTYIPNRTISYIGEKSNNGRGGMESKLDSAIEIAKNKIPIVIANGSTINIINNIINGQEIGTLITLNENNINENNITENNMNENNINNTDIHSIIRKMKLASRSFANTSILLRNLILSNILTKLQSEDALDYVLDSNRLDLDIADSNNLDINLKNRLKLTSDKWENLCNGLSELILMSDPLKSNSSVKLEANLELMKKRCPLGLILVIFESRPDVLLQILFLTIKTGNCVILKGGKESYYTNHAIINLINKVFESMKLITCNNGRIVPIFTYIDNRSDVDKLLKYDKDIDLVIPRGSSDLVNYVKNNTKIPVLGHSEGICHIFIDREVNPRIISNIVINSKCDSPSACNSVDTILIHQDILFSIALDSMFYHLKKNNVDIYCGPNYLKLKENLSPELQNARPNYPLAESLSKEYSCLAVTIEVVSNLKHAIRHINTYGSKHTDCIISTNKKNMEIFTNEVDSASVFCNTSTRYSDGYRYGLGAEVGISTNKIHSRGPVGMDGLLTYKWILSSDGKVV